MKMAKIQSVTKVLATTALFCLVNAASVQAKNIRYEFFDVSLPRFHLASDEQIEAFKCRVRGVIVRINAPLEWNMKLDNGTGGRSDLTAEAIVGAAALDMSHLDYFHDFLTVAKVIAPPNSSLATFLDVDVVLHVSNRAEHTREIDFHMKDLSLAPNTTVRLY
jgi:hypothetical protein